MLNELSPSLGRILPEYQLPADLLPGFLYPCFSVNLPAIRHHGNLQDGQAKYMPGSLHQDLIRLNGRLHNKIFRKDFQSVIYS